MIIDTENRWFAIVNPVAGDRKGLLDWPLISKLLRDSKIPFDFAFTEKKYHAIELAVEAINNGYKKIIVVGGDGTIHEVINGVYIQKNISASRITIAVIAVGTGNDWIRMFGIPRKYTEAIKAIVEGHTFLQDVGLVSYYKSNFPHQRYMANVAGVGFDAYVNKKYNRLKDEGKRGKWLYIWSTLKSVLRYSSTDVKLYIDGKKILGAPVYSAAIGIGKYNGGGMLQNPEAIADDGLFDVTIIRNISRIRVFANVKTLYNGKIYKVPKVSFYRGRKIRIESSPEIAIEIDGEALGYSPFEFEIIEKGINVIVAERFINDLK
ncbi:MAG: diacylglycerol kinase family lipid kinase [Rikenellaceae bacterium]|nr:diacylglycerol kinase family lipid kinase [Rikenellaceae bacterium]